MAIAEDTLFITNKKPTRHHVKRRSGKGVHVSKLASLTKAHTNEDGEKSTTTMKRSHSNKSLNKLTTTMTALNIPDSPPQSPTESITNKKPASLSRTQQKLSLQREQTLTKDENNMTYPKNNNRLTRELERMKREYQSIKTYQDPMMESLLRCQKKLTNKPTQPTRWSDLVGRLFYSF